MKTWGIVALLLLSVRVGAEPMVEVAFDRDRVVVQGPFECFPATIYNVLQTAKRQLAPYAKFLANLGGRPARRRPDCPRFQSARTEFCQFEGTRNDEQRAMVEESVREAGLPALESGYLARRPGEDGRAFIERIHRELADSVQAGMPVLARILIYQGARNFLNHAHMIYGISEEPFLDPEKGWAFRLEVFEQEWGAGQELEILVHEHTTPAPEVYTDAIIAGRRLEFTPEWRQDQGYVAAFAELEMRREGGWESLYARELENGRLAPVYLELAYGRFRGANLIPAWDSSGVATASVE